MVKKIIVLGIALVVSLLLNAVISNKLISPLLGESYASLISAVIVCLLVLLIGFLLTCKIEKGAWRDELKFGTFWVSFTVLLTEIIQPFLNNFLQ